jgi:hypothetical protein
MRTRSSVSAARRRRSGPCSDCPPEGQACARHRVRPPRAPAPTAAEAARRRETSPSQRNPPVPDRERPVLEGSQNVIPLEIGIVGQDLIDRHAPGQELQDVGYRVPQPANHRLAVTDLRVRSDSVETGHTLSVRRPGRDPAEFRTSKGACAVELGGPASVITPDPSLWRARGACHRADAASDRAIYAVEHWRNHAGGSGGGAGSEV